MKCRAGCLPVVVLAFSVALAAQEQEFARVLRNGEQATLSVFGPRPVDLAAKKLVDEFGVAINVEDPVYMYRDDVQEVGVARSGRGVLIPKASLLEMRFDLSPVGSLLDVREVVRDLVDTANAQLPFAYRIDNDGDVFTLVASRTRDEHGRSIELTPILDRHVTIPLGTRKILEHVSLLTQALEQQTGVRVSCCQAAVGGIPWGSTVIPFEARDEPARSALLRLIQSEQGNPNHVAGVEPRRYHWLLRCQPAQSWCFVNVAPIPHKP